jgi:hypothetical protein
VSESRRDRILLDAASALDDDERAALRDELARSEPGDAEALREAQELLARLALSAAPVAPPPRARQRLRERVATREALRVDPWRRSGWRGAATAGILAVISAGLAAGLTWQALVPDEPQIAESDAAAAAADLERERAGLEAVVESQDGEIAALEGALAQAREAIALLSARGMVAIDLTPGAGDEGVSARIFWDWDAYTCFFQAHGLRNAPPGHTYTLWLHTQTGDVIRAGSFEASGGGLTSFFALLPREMGDVARVVVTDEPLPVGDAPTGTVHLTGDYAADASG